MIGLHGRVGIPIRLFMPKESVHRLRECCRQVGFLSTGIWYLSDETNFVLAVLIRHVQIEVGGSLVLCSFLKTQSS
jgi:hypothetical protein